MLLTRQSLTDTAGLSPRLGPAEPMTLDQVRGGGIDFPAVVIGELELNGFVIERVHEQGKLLSARLVETRSPRSTHHTPAPPIVAIATQAHRRRQV